MMTDEEIAKIKKRRPGVRASLAIEGLILTDQEEQMLDQFENERLTLDQRRERVRAYGEKLKREENDK